MGPEDRLRRLRADDRWDEEAFVLRPAPVERARTLTPLKWASVSVGTAAVLVGVVALGSLVPSGSAASSSGSNQTSGGTAVPRTDQPGTAGSTADIEHGPGGTPSAALSPTVSRSGAIRAGSTLDDEVTLRNTGGAIVRFRICPSYVESLGSAPGSFHLTAYALNCASTRVPKPGAAAVFAMRISVPAGAAGAVTITWRLVGGRAAAATGTVVGPSATAPSGRESPGPPPSK